MGVIYLPFGDRNQKLSTYGSVYDAASSVSDRLLYSLLIQVLTAAVSRKP